MQVDHNCLLKRKLRRQQLNSNWLSSRFVEQTSRLLHGLCLCVCVCSVSDIMDAVFSSIRAAISLLSTLVASVRL